MTMRDGQRRGDTSGVTKFGSGTVYSALRSTRRFVGPRQGRRTGIGCGRKEAHDKIVARKEQAHAAATKAVEKVNQEVKSANDTANRNWSAVKAKIADDMNRLKVNVAHAKHEHDVKRAETRPTVEWEAGFAIDYAIASVEQAKLAVLDAVDGRLAAEEAKQA